MKLNIDKKYIYIVAFLFLLIIIFQLYLYTEFPAFNNDDSPETIIAGYTLGISHAPGYPFYALTSKIFSLLPIGSPAFRINLFSIFILMIVLSLSFVIIKKNLNLLFNYRGQLLNYFGVIILAFSYIIWNQAITAKGGIYLLNLLFLSILLYLGLLIFEKFNNKYLYLMAFVYGLSLTNHWPSTIILFPIIAYFYTKYLKKIKQFGFVLMFFLLGLTVYAYLPLRALENPALNIGNPVTWENFLWVVFRSGYKMSFILPNIEQIKEYFGLFLTNFSILWIIAPFGIYAIWKQNKKILVLYIITFLIITFMVAFSNGFEDRPVWIVKIFFMPTLYIILFFIITGIHFVLNIYRDKISKYIFLFIILIICIYSGHKNFIENNSRYDFCYYDFGENMLKTLETGNVYLAENDYFIMPILYSQIIEKKRLDVILAVVDFLYYNWGISNFRNKYGNIPMKEYDLNYNISNIIDAYKNKTNIFLSSYSDHMDKMQLSNNFQQFGLLKKYGVLRLHDISIVFDFYCCNRTLFDKYLHYNKGDLSLIAWYAQGIMVQGNEAMQNNNPNEAIKLYKKTLCYPSEIIVQEDIYYHLARTYELNNDMENELFYLDKVIKSKSDFWPAYEQEGIIYLRKKQFSMTINMFELAIEYGSPHRESLEQQINLVKTKL